MSSLSRYMRVGIANSTLGYGVIFSCMDLFGLSPELSNAVGYTFGLIASYFMNRYYTFRSTNQKSTEFFRFAIVFLIAYTINLAVLIVLVRGLTTDPHLSQVIASLFYIGTAYVLSKHYAFRVSSAR